MGKHHSSSREIFPAQL